MNRAAPDPKQNMGKPEPRLEGRLKVTGEARYASDMPVNNPAFAFLITSPVAKGQITAIDLADAKAVPGVLDIFTHENTGDLKHLKYDPQGGGGSTSIQDFGPKIQHDGQIIGMVVADTYEAAREAAYKAKFEIATEKPSAGFHSEGVKEASPKKSEPKAGDAEKAFDDAAVKFEGWYGTPTQHHNPIELFTTTVAWNNDELTVYEPSQFMYGLKNSLASKVGVKPEKVRAISHFVGGAFGSKAQLTPRTGLVALAAKRLNRPVKLVATRDQGFTIATYRAETQHKIRIGAQRDGKITSFQHQGWELTSRPDAYAVGGVEDSARLYSFGAVKTDVKNVHADRNTPGFMRSPPVVPYIYALESAMDELAYQLKMDPVELRRVNDGMKDATGKEWSSRSLMQCYDEAAAAFGWSKRNAEPGSMRDGDWLIGWGCASAVYPTHMGPAAARVQFSADGQARVQIAAHEIGTGILTVVGQIAAERLGIPVENVRVEVGDSVLPPAPVAGGSTQTASCCSVVAKACDAINARLNANGGTPAPAPRETVGTGTGRNHEETFARLGVATLEEYAEQVPKEVKPNPVMGLVVDPMKKLYSGSSMLGGGSHAEKLMYALGAEFVEVRVHRLTREIRVPRIVGAFAAGRIMNTRTARSQYMGGMIWGISSALHEATEIDPRYARYTNDNLADYIIPVNADIQQLEVILVPEKDDLVNPVGVKGIGELANVGTAAAVANAVFHATGVRVRELPIRLEKLLTA
ncbi:MAG: xanthine dehydrogenase family protein molybdopterin-binding subunit [Pseudolabrys sp.]|nr:xanthine dehydrogenase family protein molybdopterin-binding subunit [Pseudolabrys sp.]MBV9956438.1 xanthine dehydrogenase family protein molybdopterin-binding subunit [Pseudolabrys sp.]